MKNPGVTDFLKRSLDEDIGVGDITTLLTVNQSTESRAKVFSKVDMIIAGMPFFSEVFKIYDPSLSVKACKSEGQRIEKGETIATVSGKSASILSCERVSLNILQRLSGIATLTNRFVEAVKPFPVKITDTRKTTPGMRYLEKYAVRAGGGDNHRFGLYDGILIKENHIKASGGIKEAIRRAKKGGHHLLKIEIEVTTINELKEALKEDADVIMLDNMSGQEISEAVSITREQKKVLLEVSGGVNLKNVRSLAERGVDIISIGALTHSAPAVDISMIIE